MNKYRQSEMLSKQQVGFQLEAPLFAQSHSSLQLFNKMQENYHFMDVKFRWFISDVRLESVSETEGMFISEIFSWKIWVIGQVF